MRTFSIIAAVITALLLACAGYAALTTGVEVSVVAVSSEPASNQVEAFTTVNTWVKEQNGSSITRFTGDQLGDISNYTLVYLTVEVNNWSFMPAEWVQLHVQPAAGDVLQIRQEPGTARPLGKSSFQAVLLTSAQSAEAARQVDVEYYLMGRKHTASSAAE